MGLILRSQAVKEESTLSNNTEEPISHLSRGGSQNSGTFHYLNALRTGDVDLRF